MTAQALVLVLGALLAVPLAGALPARQVWNGLAGWTLRLVTPAMVRDGRAHQWVEAIVPGRREDSGSARAEELA